MQCPKKTLQDYGYGFNSDGCLRQIDKKTGVIGNEPFQFNVADSHQECQKHYEELGEAVTEYVFNYMEQKLNLIKLPVPEDAKDNLSTCVFATRDYKINDKLLVLIHGSGVVRAGQWARSLIINHSFDAGTQMPYIKKGKELGYGILITNTNDNHRLVDNESVDIPNSTTPEEHAEYVWRTYVSKCSAKSIAIVAHSYGGIVTLHLAKKFKKDFQTKVKAIAFTDSVHNTTRTSQAMISRLQKIAKNWVTSNVPLDTPHKSPELDVPRLSAGHTKHEMTSYCAMESIFKFIEELIKNS